MQRNRVPAALTIAFCVAWPPGLAAADGHDGLLLSGYGNPGAMEQTLFSEALLPTKDVNARPGAMWLASADRAETGEGRSDGMPSATRAPASGGGSVRATAGRAGGNRDAGASARRAAGDRPSVVAPLGRVPIAAAGDVGAPAPAGAGLPVPAAGLALLAGLALILTGAAVLTRGRGRL